MDTLLRVPRHSVYHVACCDAVQAGTDPALRTLVSRAADLAATRNVWNIHHYIIRLVTTMYIRTDYFLRIIS